MPKILIVDDDTAYVQIYRAKLQAEGYQVDYCSDSIAALEKIKDKYDLILSDLMMPQMDGLQLLAEIKKGINKDSIIIAHTNLISEKNKQEFLTSGASEYLIKADYTPNQLVEIINSYLKK